MSRETIADALTGEELADLMKAAESGPVVLKVPGPDRAMLYRLAAVTGFEPTNCDP